MNLTPKIKIGGVTYAIILSPDLELMEKCTGKVDFTKAQIHLEESLDPKMMMATIIHEILETINEENEYKLPHRTIQSMATQLFQVIEDNPEVFK